MPATRRRRGRPSLYSLQRARLICARIAAGESVTEIAADAGMPCISTIFKWVAEKPEFSASYREACVARAWFLSEEILAIADDGTNDFMERRRARSGKIERTFDREAVQRSKLRIWTRCWVLARMLPDQFSELSRKQIGGARDGLPIMVQQTETSPREEIEARLDLIRQRMYPGVADDVDMTGQEPWPIGGQRDGSS